MPGAGKNGKNIKGLEGQPGFVARAGNVQDAEPSRSLIFPSLFGNINPKLLSFLVKMAALQAKYLSGLCDLVTTTLQFGEDSFPFEALYSFRERTRASAR